MSLENPQLETAVRYAGHGWPVFPLAPGTKVPLKGSEGLLEATTDERQVVRWFERHPFRNIGIATGQPGPDVLDVDTKGERSNGYAAWNTIKREGLIGTPQAVVRTPSGGMHAFWRGTEQRNGALKEHSLDYRARGGYVAAVPSLVAGKRYEVVQSQRSADTCDWQAIRNHLEPQAERPAWHPPADGRPREVGHLVAWVAGLQEGNRDNGVFWAACRAVEAGDEETVRGIARAALSTGLTEREVQAKIRSAQRTASPKAGLDREAG